MGCSYAIIFSDVNDRDDGTNVLCRAGNMFVHLPLFGQGVERAYNTRRFRYLQSFVQFISISPVPLC